jgi:agmatine deiminase
MPDRDHERNIPAEWARHEAVWTAWPSHEELWREDLEGARREVAAMVAALAAGDVVKVLACGDDAVASAKNALDGLAEVIPATFGDIWLRDTGPIFALAGGRLMALRFANNGWGGKYLLPGDDSVGDIVAQAAGAAILRFDFVLEGGAVEHNGSGSILTTRQCVLNANRNGGWTQPQAEKLLCEAFHAKRVLWLDNGLLNDHTDGHVDNLARFVAHDSVLCQAASGDDDPNAQLYETIAEALLEMGLEVHRIPSPGRVCDAGGKIMPASHMNFIIGNEAVVVPVYNERYGNEAVQALQNLFPQHRVVGVASNHLLTGGGSFHCITQQQPAC